MQKNTQHKRRQRNAPTHLSGRSKPRPAPALNYFWAGRLVEGLGAGGQGAAGSGNGQTTDTSHAAASPTTQPKMTSAMRWAPALMPLIREWCSNPAAMTKAQLMGACRHMV
jgi:hypothetical protein